MLKKRLIATIIVKDGWAVQSFGYRKYLPLGKPECLAENLDRWGADEILLLSIDRTRGGLGPDFPVLERISRLYLSTPLIYGGGIRNTEDAVAVIQRGADRLCVDALLDLSPRDVVHISNTLGAQAVVAGLPLSRKGEILERMNYLQGTSEPLRPGVLSLFEDGTISEALVIDWRNEGRRSSFDPDLVRYFPLKNVPLLAFGGLSEPEQLMDLLVEPNVSAVAIGNFLNYREHAVQELKRRLADAPLRPAVYIDHA